MDQYSIFKTLHIVGVVMFVGNIAVTGWWKVMADRTRDPKIIAFAQAQVTLTDYVFTAGGIVLLGIGALGAARAGGLSLTQTPWIALGNALFVASGVVWTSSLGPSSSPGLVSRMIQRSVRTWVRGMSRTKFET